MRRAIDRASPIPAYVQILQQLRAEVLALPAGAAVASERELAERFSVSRMTAREAVRILRQEGLLYHERGRGMFVVRRKLDLHERPGLAGFSAEMRDRGLAPRTRLLRFERVLARGDIAQHLRLAAGASVYRIERLRLSDEVPMVHECTHVPMTVFPSLYRYDLSRDALYRILREDAGVRFARAAEELEAAAAGRTIGRLFQMSASDPVLSIRRIVFDTSDRPIETTRSIYRADRYRATFEVRI